jgi:twitching motility two-component system response regulator PilG
MTEDLSGIKVMVIDDSKTIRKTAEALLAKTGCTVVTAEDGFQALSAIVREQPDLIFIDVMMPRLDGYETCSIIRSNEKYSDTPIVMLSSKSSFCDKARGDVVGANAYLTKPFSRDELLDAITRYAVADKLAGAVPASA